MEVSESPYRALTRAVEVEIALDGDRYETVSLFLSTLSETHAGPETLDEALNHERDFIPVRSNETEQTFLIRRRAIRRVTVSDDVAAECRAHDEAFSVCGPRASRAYRWRNDRRYVGDGITSTEAASVGLLQQSSHSLRTARGRGGCHFRQPGLHFNRVAVTVMKGGF